MTIHVHSIYRKQMIKKQSQKLQTSIGSQKKQENSRKKKIYFCFINNTKTFDYVGTSSLVAQRLKRLPPMRETRVQSLGQEDPHGEGNGNPLQYSCLENSMDGKAWYAIVHGVPKSRTRLRDFTYLLTYVGTQQIVENF